MDRDPITERRAGLIASTIQQFLLGETSFKVELAERSRKVDHQREILAWTVSDGYRPNQVLRLRARLFKLQCSVVQLLCWEDELSLVESILNSMLRK
jgi:hypothetical protein